jgi:hypothetical protein
LSTSGKAFAEFTEKKANAKKSHDTPQTMADIAGKRSHRGKRISIHLRLTEEQWKAVHAIAFDENTTVQGFFIYAADRVFKERGRPFAEAPEKSTSRDIFEKLAP